MEPLPVALAVVTSLMLLVGIPGNALLTVTWPRHGRLNNPFAANMVALDLLVMVSGAAPVLATVVVGSDWLTNHVVACDVIAFLNVHALFGSALTLLFLLEYSRHAQNFSILRKRGKSKNCLFIGATWLLPLMVSLPPLMGWGSFRFDRALGSCACVPDPYAATNPVNDGHSYFFVLTYFLLSLIQCALSIHWSRQLNYSAQVNWQMHMLEMKMNDPERTTAHSTSSTLGSTCLSYAVLGQGISLPQGWRAQCLEVELRNNYVNETRALQCTERAAGVQSEEFIPRKGGEERTPEGEEEAIGGHNGRQEKALVAIREKGKEQQHLVVSQGEDVAKEHGDTIPEQHPDHQHLRGNVPTEQPAEPEASDKPAPGSPPTTGRKQRFVPTPLELPTRLPQSYYLGTACKRLQSPRFLHSPIVHQGQREILSVVLVIAGVSLIGCLPVVVVRVLELASVRCPEITRVLAILFLYLRSAVAPMVNYLHISECRKQLGRAVFTCCVAEGSVSEYHVRRAVSQAEIYNHLAIDPPDTTCRSMRYI